MAGLAASPARAQDGPADASPGPDASTGPDVTPATTAPGSAAPDPAGPGPTAPVDWFPLRANPDGRPVKLGCTYRSQGAQFGYACGGHHDRWALDLIAETGTEVHAVRLGFATNATGQRGGSGYGNVVRVDHGDGTESLYAHLSQVLVPAEGAWVDERSVIGLVGSTGSSSAPHLHYEKRVLGQQAPVDPGPLAACVLGHQVAYPAIAGHESWYGLPWGSFELTSDGSGCASATPATPVRRPGVGRIEDRLPTGDLLRALVALGLTSTAG